jgi:transcriptional regulator with XRE-family HTH domain
MNLISLKDFVLLQRRKRGLTQRDLATLAGVSRNYISLIECGDADGVTLKTAASVLSALGYRFEITETDSYRVKIE